MKLSVVATLYYSEQFIEEFYNRLVRTVKEITPDYEIIFVNDGSPDSSQEKVLNLRKTDPNVSLIELSRNFGHQRAIITGLNHAEGDYIFLIDTDLEEAPELLMPLWQELRQNPDADVAYGMQKNRKGGWFERITGEIHYKLFSFLADYDYPPNPLTARLMSKRYLEALKNFTETE